MSKPDPILVGLYKEIKELRKDVERLKAREMPSSATPGHTHPPGDANTLDGIDSTGFSLASHAHFGDSEGDPAAVNIVALDGTSAFAARRDHVHTMIDGLALFEILDDDGPGSGLDADLLDGVQGSGYSLVSHTHTHVGVHLRHGSNQSIPDSAWTALSFDTEFWDTNSFHNTVTNNSRITIPAGLAGKYAIWAGIAFNTNTTGYRMLAIWSNGINVLRAMSQIPISGQLAIMAISADAVLDVGDYLEVKVYQTSGSPLDLLTTNFYSPDFGATYLGA